MSYALPGFAAFAGFGLAHPPNGEAGVQYFQSPIGTSFLRTPSDPKLWPMGQFGGDAAGAAIGLNAKQGILHYAGTGLQVGLGALNVVHGFHERGFAGATDAIAWDVSVNAAVHHWYHRPKTVGGITSLTRYTQDAEGILANGGRFASQASKFVGGGIGASIGQGIGRWALGDGTLGTGAATAGAYLGGYLGAAAATTEGLMVMGGAGLMAAPLIATAAGGYGLYRTIDAGVQYQRNRRQINTDGSMAAFYTQGAQTMRSRAVQAIARSHTNARSALGMEANFMHTNKNYFSPYRAG